MSGSVALTGLAALLALAGCFQLSPKSCEVLCTQDKVCPGDLRCVIQDNATYGVCTAPNESCPPLFSEDASMPPMDAGGPDADAGGPLPPDMLCHNGACFTLPDAVRANLVLLLWPSNLPPVGSSVSVWKDQSGQGNDAHALYPTTLPEVIADGVHLDPTQNGSGFVVPNSPSLDLGSRDFAAIVVSGLSSTGTPVTLFRKSDGARTNSRQVAIDWVPSSAVDARPQGTVDDTLVPSTMEMAQPSIAAYTLYRSADHVELHVNGAVVGSADLPTAGLSTTNTEDVYVGVGSLVGVPADSIEATILIRGPIGSNTLNQMETFLRDGFAKAAQ